MTGRDEELMAWLQPFLAQLGHKRRRRMSEATTSCFRIARCCGAAKPPN